jgi:putative component of membrane protein insertase Oxa1/YidC/SpoIIIJ protein YidD
LQTLQRCARFLFLPFVFILEIKCLPMRRSSCCGALTGLLTLTTTAIALFSSMVVNYNKYMGGVDRSDQMISYTNSIVKSFKWWKRWSSMFWLLRCLMHTSCSSLRIQILLSHTVFRKRFVTELVQNNACQCFGEMV